MLYISVFCKHIETYLNIGYNLVLSAKTRSLTVCEASFVFTSQLKSDIMSSRRLDPKRWYAPGTCIIGDLRYELKMMRSWTLFVL